MIDQKAPRSKPTREQLRGIDILWLVLVLTIAATQSLRPVAAVDQDLWWHLRAGDWITLHHAVPWQDVFGRYTLGHTWIDYTWLFDVFVASIYKLNGLNTILAFTGTLILASVTCVFGLLSKYLSQGYALILSTLFLLVILPVATPRPWLFSIFLLILELRLLLRASEQNRPHLLFGSFRFLRSGRICTCSSCMAWHCCCCLPSLHLFRADTLAPTGICFDCASPGGGRPSRWPLPPLLSILTGGESTMSSGPMPLKNPP